MIERVKLSSAAKQQLITLKRRTGIEHYNVICRHALCLSLENSSRVPHENIDFSNGIEIDWKVFAGELVDTYENLLIIRSIKDERKSDQLTVRQTLSLHIHRGLSYRAAQQNHLIPTHQTISP